MIYNFNEFLLNESVNRRPKRVMVYFWQDIDLDDKISNQRIAVNGIITQDYEIFEEKAKELVPGSKMRSKKFANSKTQQMVLGVEGYKHTDTEIEKLIAAVNKESHDVYILVKTEDLPAR